MKQIVVPVICCDSCNRYKSNQTIEDFESTFNDLYIYPFLKVVANVLSETKETS